MVFTGVVRVESDRPAVRVAFVGLSHLREAADKGVRVEPGQWSQDGLMVAMTKTPPTGSRLLNTTAHSYHLGATPPPRIPGPARFPTPRLAGEDGSFVAESPLPLCACSIFATLSAIPASTANALLGCAGQAIKGGMGGDPRGCRLMQQGIVCGGEHRKEVNSVTAIDQVLSAIARCPM